MYKDALAKLRSIREQTIHLIENLDQPASDRIPSPGKWSISEILDHLILTDAFYQKDVSKLVGLGKTNQSAVLRRTFSEFNASPRFFPKPLMILTTPFLSFAGCFVPRFLRETMMRNAILPFQNPDVVKPRKGRKLDSLKVDLREYLHSIETILNENPDLNYNELFHYHPILGKNTIPQLLKLMARHEQRHQDQIQRILNN